MSTLTMDDGAELFYKEAGSGPPLLLIHGTGIDADTWGECFDDLAADHRVVAYVRRGSSRTRDNGVKPTADWARHAADAAAFLEQLELAPATVVGWSAGGLIATKLMASKPELVWSLVLVEPGYDAPHNLTAGYLRAFVSGGLLFALRRDRAAYDRFMRFACHREGGVNSWEDPDFPAERRERGRANAAMYKAEMAARRGLPTPDEVRRIDVPTTVIVGEQTNPWFKKMATAVAAAIPGAVTERIPNANHAFGFTAPHELAAAVRGAVARAKTSDRAGIVSSWESATNSEKHRSAPAP